MFIKNIFFVLLIISVCSWMGVHRLVRMRTVDIHYIYLRTSNFGLRESSASASVDKKCHLRSSDRLRVTYLRSASNFYCSWLNKQTTEHYLQKNLQLLSQRICPKKHFTNVNKGSQLGRLKTANPSNLRFPWGSRAKKDYSENIC